MGESTGQKGPTNSVMLQYYSKQELLRNEPSLTQTDNDLGSSNYMVKESRGMLHIGIGMMKKGGMDTVTGSQRGEQSNKDLARTLLNMDSIGTIEGSP